MKTRITSAAAGALIALAVSLVAFAGAPGALAIQGQSLLAGLYNDETHSTDLVNVGGASANGNGLVVTASSAAKGYGVYATGYGPGNAGVFGTNPGGPGVRGESPTRGVYGLATAFDGEGVFGQGAIGVEGFGTIGVSGSGGGQDGAGVVAHGTQVPGLKATAYNAPAITATALVDEEGRAKEAIHGESSVPGGKAITADGDAYGVFAQSGNGTGVAGFGSTTGVTGSSGDTGVLGSGNFYGVHGVSPNVGVLAESSGSFAKAALQVKGKAQFSRSGLATVTGSSATPKNSVRVSLSITSKSMMTATMQKFVPGVFVVAAVPNVTGDYFTIYLNKKVSTAVGPISWMVTERP